MPRPDTCRKLACKFAFLRIFTRYYYDSRLNIYIYIYKRNMYSISHNGA